MTENDEMAAIDVPRGTIDFKCLCGADYEGFDLDDDEMAGGTWSLMPCDECGRAIRIESGGVVVRISKETPDA